MKAKFLICLGLALIWIAQPAFATPFEILSMHADTLGGISVVIKTKEGIQSPDGSHVQDKIPMEGPLTAKEVSSEKNSSRFGFLWLVFVGILVLILIVFISRKTKKPTKDEQKQKSYSEPPETDDYEARQLSPRQTQVGGYNFPVPRAQNPTAILVGVSGLVEGQRFSIEKEIFFIGADKENDLPIPEDDYLSSKHAFLKYEHGNLFIFDRGSQNGTFVNEKPVTEAGVALNIGDRIRLGGSSFDIVKGA